MAPKVHSDPDYKPISVPGHGEPEGPGPPNAQARQATRWTVGGYFLLLVAFPIIDYIQDRGMLWEWDPDWMLGVVMLGNMVLVAALAMALRALARPGGRTKATRRRIGWLVVLTVPTILWITTVAAFQAFY